MVRCPWPRPASVLLICLSLVLVGTCVVLGSVWSFFHVDRRAIILPHEVDMILASLSGDGGAVGSPTVPPVANDSLPAAPLDPAVYEGHFTPGVVPKKARPGEKIPRLIHQTWKTSQLPDRWVPVREECQAMHPDYDYILWTDGDSRAFIEKHYHWFLPVFDAYPYPIQRADAIRYFVLHHFGGVYMDLDMGCLKPMDPLLSFEAIVPETIPIGVSNDLMLITPRHPFMERLLTHLVLFDHNYLLNYATVMFSTGPMLVSASYSLWADAQGVSLPSDADHPRRGQQGVRVLPKSLYGKNLPADTAQDHAFYKHFYGSSWHANDAGWVQALGRGGKYLFFLGVAVVIYLGLQRAGLVRPAGALLAAAAPLCRARLAFGRPWTRPAHPRPPLDIEPEQLGLLVYNEPEPEPEPDPQAGAGTVPGANPLSLTDYATRIDMQDADGRPLSPTSTLASGAHVRTTAGTIRTPSPGQAYAPAPAPAPAHVHARSHPQAYTPTHAHDNATLHSPPFGLSRISSRQPNVPPSDQVA